MKGAISLLTERSGKIHSAEGEHDVLQAMFPDWSDDTSLFSLVPTQQHAFISEILHNITRNSEGRISDVSLLTAYGELVLFHLTVQPAGPGLWWFKFIPSDSQAGQLPRMIWMDFFDSVSYLVESSPEKPIELMLLSFEALDDPETTERIGKERMVEVRDAIEATLRSRAVNGQIGRMDDTSYAVMYDTDTDADDIVHDVGNAT